MLRAIPDCTIPWLVWLPAISTACARRSICLYSSTRKSLSLCTAADLDRGDSGTGGGGRKRQSGSSSLRFSRHRSNHHYCCLVWQSSCTEDRLLIRAGEEHGRQNEFLSQSVQPDQPARRGQDLRRRSVMANHGGDPAISFRAGMLFVKQVKTRNIHGS